MRNFPAERYEGRRNYQAGKLGEWKRGQQEKGLPGWCREAPGTRRRNTHRNIVEIVSSEAKFPEGSRFKGYQDFLVQAVLQPAGDPVRRERWIHADDARGGTLPRTASTAISGHICAAYPFLPSIIRAGHCGAGMVHAA